MDVSTARARLPNSIAKVVLLALLPSLALLLIAPSVGDAQEVVVTNITPSALPACPGPCGAGVTIVNPLPPAQGGTITITGGARPGNGLNLFHSFGQFDVGAGDVANFQNTQVNGAFPATSNILSRVTGGNQSQIYGTIQTTDFSGANLFLMNPAGVLFGPSAALDLGAVTGSAVREPGSFSATTADYLNLVDANGTSPFYADPLKASVLSVAPVAAFGFLGSNPAPITVQGSMLQVPEGQALSLVGGDITVQAGTIGEDGATQAASLRAPGGQISLVSVASPGEVLVPNFQTGPNINGTSFTSMGTVTIKEGSTLDVSGRLDEFGNPIGNGKSGTVFVRGGQLIMDASTILATTVGAVDGASTAIDIQVLQDVTISNRAVIITRTSGPGRVGDVHITAGSLTLENRSRITTAISELGVVGGDLFLNVGRLSLLGSGTLIRSINTSGTDLDGDGTVDATGKGGNITIQGIQGANSVADSVVLSDSSGITSDAQPGSGGGGRISIRTNSLDLNEASFITSSTSSTGIDLNHDGNVDATGDGGDIVMSVQQLSVVGGATISSNTGDADPTSAAAGGMVTVQGLEGQGSKASSVLLSDQSAGIFSFSESGVPGDLTVNAGTLTITNGAVISAGNSISGPAGQVTIEANSIVISGEGRISSQSFAQDAGQVTLTANELTMDNGSIETSTASENGGRGGDVVLDVRTGTVSLTNGASINSQSLINSTGRAGDITMNVKSLTLANQAEITSSSKGTAADAGEAGNITIHSGSTVVMNNSSITTEAEKASGGQIEINAPEMVRLTNSEVSTSVKGVTGESNGGNITIDPQFVILQNSQIIAQANAGAGGAINVTAGVFLADPNSVVSASSQQGPQGTVNIQSPVQNLGEQLTPLTQQFSSAASLLAQRCAARVADGKFSTFVVAGREGLPMEPGGFLASPSWTAELLGSNLSGLYPHPPIAAVAGSFPKYDAMPIQLAKYGDACR